jgi:hypothetical protein
MPLFADKRVVGNDIKSSKELLEKFPELEVVSDQMNYQIHPMTKAKYVVNIILRKDPRNLHQKQTERSAMRKFSM